MPVKLKIISLRHCAEDLAISNQWMRDLFHNTKFWPIFRINNIAYYIRKDFEGWKKEHWKGLSGKFKPIEPK